MIKFVQGVQGINRPVHVRRIIKSMPVLGVSDVQVNLSRTREQKNIIQKK